MRKQVSRRFRRRSSDRARVDLPNVFMVKKDMVMRDVEDGETNGAGAEDEKANEKVKLDVADTEDRNSDGKLAEEYAFDTTGVDVEAICAHSPDCGTDVSTFDGKFVKIATEKNDATESSTPSSPFASEKSGSDIIPQDGIKTEYESPSSISSLPSEHGSAVVYPSSPPTDFPSSEDSTTTKRNPFFLVAFLALNCFFVTMGLMRFLETLPINAFVTVVVGVLCVLAVGLVVVGVRAESEGAEGVTGERNGERQQEDVIEGTGGGAGDSDQKGQKEDAIPAIERGVGDVKVQVEDTDRKTAEL